MNTRVEIDAGVCGFRTCVRAISEDSQNVSFDIASGCEKIRALAGALNAKGSVDAYQEISPDGQSVVMAVVRETLRGCCAGCVVPAGVFKAMQVAAGLALPKDISIRMTQE